MAAVTGARSSSPRPSLARGATPALWLAVIIAGCGVDERPLSFTIGEHTSPDGSGSSGGNPDVTSSGQGGGASTDSGAGAGSEPVGGRGGMNGGGKPAVGGRAGSSANGGANGGQHMNGGSANGGVASGGASIGGASVAGMGGMAGSGGAPLIFPCGDLNQNYVDDCAETLVKNSRFDTDTKGWEAEPLLQQHWDPTNATGGTSSGSLFVANMTVIPSLTGYTTVGSRQCISALTAQRYDVGARVFIKGGQGSGDAGINLLIFADDGCTGTYIGGQTVRTVADVDAWRVLEGEVAMPPAARSMYVRLVASKPLAQASLQVLFDDVLVSEKK
jgi:hypothetical protein